ncbi:hypothetical protein, partial [Escherichia marmotae]|uniref:hypothetical protein n=1 Tax=Escherichia marmotae TaxID=1499973 RepID=UPI002F346A9E
TITYLSDTGCLEIQGASLVPFHLYSSYFKLHELRLKLLRVTIKKIRKWQTNPGQKKELILERSAKLH